MPTDPSVPNQTGAQPETEASGRPGRSGQGFPTALVKWGTRASVAGVVLSLLVHAIVGLVAGMLTIRYPHADAGGELAGTEVEFAVMTESELAAALDRSEETITPLVPESSTATDPAALDLTEAAPPSADTLTETTLDVELDTGAGDIGEDTGGGLVSGAGDGGASFFGLEAQGSRFAYIVDRSSSMRGPKMSRTRAELGQSFTGLSDNAEFLIVFYSDGPEALGGRPQWRDASERSKTEARSLIEAVQPSGGTKPMPAFELVFGRRVKPDAIYFMTDGRFDADVPGRISSLNRRFRIPIHCILFGEPSTNNLLTGEVRDMMRRIADESDGRFRHVEVGP